MGKIAKRLKKIFQDQLDEKVFSLSDFKKGKDLAVENLNSIKSVEELIGQGISQSDAVYCNMQNLVSVLMEGLVMLPPAASMYRFFSKQEDLYQPGYPPQSPITNSYYNLWLQFDSAFGDDNETIGSCILEMSDILNIREVQLKALTNLCNSRMGIYEIAEIRPDYSARLRELVSDLVYEVTFDKNYSGQKGDIVYLRLLTDLLGDGPSTVFGVPYHICGYSENEWVNYFKKYGVIKDSEDFKHNLHQHLKYGSNRNYWIEYTFWAYMQHRPDVIYLTGMPDNIYSQAAHQQFNSHLKYAMAFRKIESRLIKPSKLLTRGHDLGL